MSKVPRTIGFGAILLTVASGICIWCMLVHERFCAVHPDGFGAALAHFFWDFSWVGIVVALIFAVALVIAQVKKWKTFYEVIFYFGLWLMVFWFCAALIGMEVTFVPWFDLHGANY